jgi:DNA-binding transcriptional ArsR family regulator
LRENGILDTKRVGPFVYYKVKDQRLLSALGIFMEIANSMDNPELADTMFFSPPWWRTHWNNWGK